MLMQRKKKSYFLPFLYFRQTLVGLIFNLSFPRDTPAFGLYMILYDFFVNQFESQTGLALFWAGGMAGNLVLQHGLRKPRLI